MLGVDTNILVYAHRKEAAEHTKAFQLLKELVEGSEPWALTWPSFYEFVRIVTHPRVFSPPTPLDTAVEFLEHLLPSPALFLLGHGESHWSKFRESILGAQAVGNLAFDAQIAALMHEHGVRKILTRDGDFHRFRHLEVSNPFV